MDRLVEIKVKYGTATADSKFIGVVGDANITEMRVTFAADWTGFTKTLYMWDARGENPVAIVLGTNLLEDILVDGVYIVPIPAEPLAYSGTNIIAVFEGTKTVETVTTVQRTANLKFTVLEAYIADGADAPAPVTQELADQLQAEIDALLPALQADVTAAQAAKTAAELAETNAETAETNSETAQGLSEAARDAAVIAKTASESARDAAQGYQTGAQNAQAAAIVAKDAALAAQNAAETAEDGAQAAQAAIEAMTASATGLAAGAAPTVTKSTVEGVVNLAFGIPQGAKGDKGDTGDTGATGATGPAGADGTNGTNGIDGIDGATWLCGAVDPTTEGKDGDFYLNTVSYDVFKKVSGGWGTAILNIKGVTGATGPAGATGATGATGETGATGAQGYSIASVTRTAGTGAAGTTDTYSITINDGTSTVVGTFTVYNGADGEGAGDMLATVYDTNADGKVNAADDADKFGGQLPAYYSLSTHNHTGVYEPAKGADDNYVTDAEKVIIGNTSGTNTGDQASTDFDIKDLTDSTGLRTTWNGKQDALGFTAVPNTRTVNGKALSSDITLSATDVSAVPTTRTVNGKALSSNITLTNTDVGAAAASHTHAATEINIADSGGHFTATNVEAALSELFTSVSDGKTLVASAITDMEVETEATDSFSTMASNIRAIPLVATYTIDSADGNQPLTKVSSVTSLSVARRDLAGASVGDYALAMGGYGSTYSAVVDAYNTSLTRSTPTALSVARNYLAGASVGNYALAMGGYTGSVSSVVDAYGLTLTRTTPTVLSAARRYLAGATVGNYALAAGGDDGSVSAVVDAYSTSLTRSTPTALSVARRSPTTASIGDYALVMGGYTGSVSAVVDAYNTSLTRSTPTALSAARYLSAGAHVGDYALAMGGYTGSVSAVVDAYNTSLTRSTPTALSVARYSFAGASVGDYALAMGGAASGGSSKVVDAYNTSLTRSTPSELSTAREVSAGVTVESYAFAFGSSATVSTVDGYQNIAGVYLKMMLAPGTKYKFNDSDEVTVESQTTIQQYVTTGYIKFADGTIS